MFGGFIFALLPPRLPPATPPNSPPQWSRHLVRAGAKRTPSKGGHLCDAFGDPLELALYRGIPLLPTAPTSPPLLPQILPPNGLATWSCGYACRRIHLWIHLWIRLWICWDGSSGYLGRLWISQVSVSGNHFCDTFGDPLELAYHQGIFLLPTPPFPLPRQSHPGAHPEPSLC